LSNDNRSTPDEQDRFDAFVFGHFFFTPPNQILAGGCKTQKNGGLTGGKINWYTCKIWIKSSTISTAF